MTETYKSRRTKGPMNNCCWERLFLGMKSPENESSWKQKVRGTKVPGNKKSQERKVSGINVIIIIIKRKDLGGIMSKRLQGHLTTLNQSENASATQNCEQSVSQMRS